MSVISFKHFVSESINDKGIFKAIFVVGSPGSGKSYTVSKLKGVISPLVVNTDRATEHFAAKFKTTISSENWPEYRDSAHRITKAQLYNYINGMLPLFVDGTSSDVSNILHRIGILESVGYDVGMIFVDVKLETAIARAEARAKLIGRKVDEEFIREVHSKAQENKSFLKTKISFFREINNDDKDTVLTNEEMNHAFGAVQGFFGRPVINPVGKRAIEKIKNESQKYLTPTVMSEGDLSNKVNGWYKR